MCRGKNGIVRKNCRKDGTFLMPNDPNSRLYTCGARDAAGQSLVLLGVEETDEAGKLRKSRRFAGAIRTGHLGEDARGRKHDGWKKS